METKVDEVFMKKKLIKKLEDYGYNQIKKPREKLIKFTDNQKWNKYLSDIEDHSHLFVLACLGDKRIKAKRAWEIPMKIGESIGGFDFDRYSNLSANQLKSLFRKNSLHHFTDKVAFEYYEGINKIKVEYGGVAKRIWEDSMQSSSIVRKFLEFNGIGPKIAGMAVNILLRQFNLDIKDLQWIDISPDVHVVRVFKRAKLVRPEASNDEVVWKARELHSKYPGVLDIACYRYGKDYCKKRTPNCSECPLSNECLKFI